MESTQLRVFAAVAQLGSITRAAEALHTVQSNVTMHIKALEGELGVPLLNRHRRGVSLTRAGEQLLPYAVKSQGLLEAARQAIAGPHRKPVGMLRLGTLETTAAIRLPQIVARFGTKYPEVDLSLTTGTTGSLVQEVLEYRLEGAFVAGPVMEPEIATEKMFVEELAIMTAPNVADVRQLAKADEVKMLVFRQGCSYRVRLERILHAAGVEKIKLMEFGTLDGILGCTSAGLGITMLPKALLKTTEHRNNVRVHRLSPEETYVETIFIRRKDGFVSPAMAAFLEFSRKFSNGQGKANDHARVAAKGRGKAR